MTAADSNSITEKGSWKTALSVCEAKGFEPKLVEIQNTDTKEIEVFNISNGTFSTAANSKIVKDKACSALFVKDKYSISDQAFHELSMITPGLPSSSTIKTLATSMNSKFNISPGIIGVQQSLRLHIAYHIKSLLEKNKRECRSVSQYYQSEIDGGWHKNCKGIEYSKFRIYHIRRRCQGTVSCREPHISYNESVRIV